MRGYQTRTKIKTITVSCIDGRSIKVLFRSEMLVKDIKEVLERGFTDLYDAFADMDGDRDGRVSLHDFHQALQGIDGSEDLTGDQIDAAFNKCKSDDNGLVVFKDFHAAFEGQARTANDAGEIASSIVPRAFEEVTSACTFSLSWQPSQ